MTGTRRHLTRDDLAPLARAATCRGLLGVGRLRGGTKKGVYRLTLDDGTTVVAYVWSPDEDYWDAGPADPRDPFSPGTSLDVFTAAHDRLVAAGVRTPRLLHSDTTMNAVVVEDMRGGSLEEALERDPVAGRAALERFADVLETLHAQEGPALGKVGLVDNGGTSSTSSAARRVTEGALRDIEEAAVRDERIAVVREDLEETLRRLAAAVRPRTRHVLIHGELGPDHVLLDDRGRPALIDIEGLMYFDVEWEHVFLRIRFDERYDALRAPDLDEARLHLYRLAMHLSLVAGPLRLTEGDFPNPGWMREIAEHNLARALELVGR
ncbi:tRNA A-37 threonylcarbamoyl transferase component Bud32 [Streptomyces sp. SAI-135]|uniref:phosphotransferase family protein n=1 Tax=unclassified Streptomyces TaxID=2593676 RepID=UPI0024772800|nr:MULTISPECIES: phosphotransferase [unclassified Streptomyces]MDH6516742.1 tRNA A-37 threonylcarbamoyl transferase component Bud32 [Streptomyces sp. SAI-090]MDH6619169.1 tRNA A-37 threonylcarbamoyl transferase component Bud32 [Streptomyces sp. SAI-135]